VEEAALKWEDSEDSDWSRLARSERALRRAPYERERAAEEEER